MFDIANASIMFMSQCLKVFVEFAYIYIIKYLHRYIPLDLHHTTLIIPLWPTWYQCNSDDWVQVFDFTLVGRDERFVSVQLKEALSQDPKRKPSRGATICAPQVVFFVDR